MYENTEPGEICLSKDLLIQSHRCVGYRLQGLVYVEFGDPEPAIKPRCRVPNFITVVFFQVAQ